MSFIKKATEMFTFQGTKGAALYEKLLKVSSQRQITNKQKGFYFVYAVTNYTIIIIIRI